MANSDAVGQLYQDSFSNSRLAVARTVSLNTGGNAVVTLPLLSGGLTNGGATANSGGVIIRRVTIQNPTGSVSSANVSITTTADNTNVVVANIALTALTGTGTYQDLNVASVYLGNVVSGVVTQALYVNVNTKSGNANTVDICVYGDVVSF
jgi:hypothetical protein